jgi:hypothetical protein
MKEYTFDTEMAIANLRNIKKVLELINDRRASVSSAELPSLTRRYGA